MEYLMEISSIDYILEGKLFKGYMAVEPDSGQQRPAILIAPAWQGQDEFSKEKARELAKMGYVAFVADLYGNGMYAEKPEEAKALMNPLFVDRKTLRARIVAAYEKLKTLPYVDTQRIGAIGFCFGGLTVIELLRSGMDVKGVVSFHGVLGETKGELKAQTVPLATPILGALLILHGHEDPLVSQADVTSIQNEFTHAGVDWQMHIYGHTKHAFTNPQAHDQTSGLVFNLKASKRSWKAMTNFFKEIFN